MRRLRWIVTAAVVAAAVGHLWWWYAARIHPGSPSAAGWRWLDAAAGDAVWLAHPHQNLGSAAAGFDLKAAIDAGCRLTSQGPCPRLESVGPWLVPPAAEAVVSLDGRLVAVRPYPTIRILGRLAGWLADNPWLEGGPVREGEAVRWDGGWWVLDRGFALEADSTSRHEAEAVVAMIKLATPRAGLGSGVFPVAAATSLMTVGAVASPASPPGGCGVASIRIERLPDWLDQGLVLAEAAESLPRFALAGRELELRQLRENLEPLSRRWREQQRGSGRIALASDDELLAELTDSPVARVSLCADVARLDATVGSLLRGAGELPLLASRDRRRLTAAADLAAALAPLGVIEWRAEAEGATLSWSTAPGG